MYSKTDEVLRGILERIPMNINERMQLNNFR